MRTTNFDPERVLEEGRSKFGQLFLMGQHRHFLLIFVLFINIFYRKIEVFSRIRTKIVGKKESWPHADHLTTTKAQTLAQVFPK